MVKPAYPKFDLRNEFQYEGHTWLMPDEGEGTWIRVDILIRKEVPCSGLIQLLGHEMVHVHQFTSGRYQDWMNEYNEKVEAP